MKRIVVITFLVSFIVNKVFTYSSKPLFRNIPYRASYRHPSKYWTGAGASFACGRTGRFAGRSGAFGRESNKWTYATGTSTYASGSEYLDDDNRNKLEKIFDIKNRRYSPYNKRIYKQVVEHQEPDGRQQQVISRKIIEELAQEFQEAYEESQNDEELMDQDFKRLIDDAAIDKLPKEGQNNGYFDDTGVFRYRDPTIFVIPKTQRSSSSSNSDDSDGSANFQIIKNSPYSFDDIGGYDRVKEELMQTADILLNYEKYRKFNVRTPKGMIFEGPPGNGKTLMAKGYSGELNISFIPVSGSEFSEKYVGVGASRIRELFKLANDNKPCIIFIDEIDALARQRGNDMISSNSEKDQTLNQLLINLDGFKDSHGVFVIGATNRLDLLDPALLRAGRMDKNIYIGNPDRLTREAIIKIHQKGKPMDSQITMNYLVDMTGGFSAAQIENLLNESMLRALRMNREIILVEDLEYIANRILAGWQAKESQFTDDMIDRIAIHEMGHAIVGMFAKEYPKLVKVCLNLWSPKTPGYTIFDVKDEDHNIYTKAGLFSHLMVLLSGRIAEDVFFGFSVTTGAKKDFEEAYKLAKSMILQYGMGKQKIYPDSSDQSKYVIDQEVNELILSAQEEALAIITKNKEFIRDCKNLLKETNVLNADDIHTHMHSV